MALRVYGERLRFRAQRCHLRLGSRARHRRVRSCARGRLGRASLCRRARAGFLLARRLCARGARARLRLALGRSRPRLPLYRRNGVRAGWCGGRSQGGGRNELCAWDWRLQELQKKNLVVHKDREGDTAPVGEVEKISSKDIGAKIHGGGAPGSKVSTRAAAVGRGGDIEAGRGGR